MRNVMYKVGDILLVDYSDNFLKSKYKESIISRIVVRVIEIKLDKKEITIELLDKTKNKGEFIFINGEPYLNWIWIHEVVKKLTKQEALAEVL